MLYRPEDFEPLTDEPWDERRVRDAIRAIVADTDAAYGGDALWPADEWDGWEAALPLKNLYVGAAGVVWALDLLRKRGHAETQLDLADAAARTLAAWRREPDFISGYELPSRPQSALMAGETGILAVAWRLSPSAELADDLLARVRENVGNEANELFWGVTGTMHAALAMVGWTGEDRWRQAWHESADALWAARDPDRLWTQRLFGMTYRSLGAPHGTAGNAHGLLRGGDLLAAERREALMRETETCSHASPSSRTVSPTGRRPRAADLSDRTTRCASSGAAARPGSSSPRPTTSTRSCCSPPPSSPGAPGRTGRRRDRASATAPPATATRS